jgi:hypothetical protein
MKPAAELEAIKQRQREIREGINKLEAESAELDVALRVFSRFSTKGKSPTKTGTKLGPPRPEGIPSNFDMISMVLKSAEKEGKKGLTANETVEEIGRRYWPGIQSPQIISFIYQFAKRGRLSKSDKGLFRVKQTAAHQNGGAAV